MKKINLGVITFDPDDANDISVQFHKLKFIQQVTGIIAWKWLTKQCIMHD